MYEEFEDKLRALLDDLGIEDDSISQIVDGMSAAIGGDDEGASSEEEATDTSDFDMGDMLDSIDVEGDISADSFEASADEDGGETDDIEDGDSDLGGILAMGGFDAGEADGDELSITKLGLNDEDLADLTFEASSDFDLGDLGFTAEAEDDTDIYDEEIDLDSFDFGAYGI